MTGNLGRLFDRWAFPVLGVGVTVALVAAIIVSAVVDSSAKARCEASGGNVEEYQDGMSCHVVGNMAVCGPIMKWRCER